MLEQLFPLTLPPGIRHTGTAYQSKGRWYDGNGVRFNQGTIGPIGGWVQRTLTGVAIVGTPNCAIAYQRNDGTQWIGLGTTGGLYAISSSNVVYNILSPTVATGSLQWQLSTFGQLLVAAFNTSGPTTAAAEILQWDGDTSDVAHGINDAPAGIAGSFLQPEGTFGAFTTAERFCVALRGAQPGLADARGGSFAETTFEDYSARRVYWCSQEVFYDWVPTATNTAGWYDLSTDGIILCGAQSRNESLIWTTADVWAMQYIGGQFVYSFHRAGNHCGIVSQRAFANLDTGAYWWGVNDKFFHYDGFVKPIECEVADYVFGSFNRTYASLVWALPNPAFNEVTWFYPSAVATSPDRYVTYNYAENHWSYGTIARVCGVPFVPGLTTVPLLIDSSGHLYNHETGNARTGQTIYLESGPMELGDGDRVQRIQRIVPDDKTVGDVSASLYTALSPDDPEVSNGPYTLTSITSVRLTARQVRLRLTEVAASAWRVGVVRLGAIAGGRR